MSDNKNEFEIVIEESIIENKEPNNIKQSTKINKRDTQKEQVVQDELDNDTEETQDDNDTGETQDDNDLEESHDNQDKDDKKSEDKNNDVKLENEDEDAKPEDEDAKPEDEDAKPEGEDDKDKNEDTKPKDEDIKPKDDKDKNGEDRKKLNPNRKELEDKSKKDNVSPGETVNKALPPEAQKAKEAADNIKEATKLKQKAAETAQNIASNITQAIQRIIEIILNPICWVTALIIISLPFVIGSFSVLGKNDFNEMCDNSGVGSVMVDVDADDFTRQSAIVAWLTSTPFTIFNNQPMTREQAVGVMGNLSQESYGANPKAIQGDHSITEWESCDNACVSAWGNTGGKAIGIIQWDTGRRQELITFASSEGTQWHDLNTQLKFLKKEIDSGYNSSQLVTGGFDDNTKTIAEYTTIWNRYFERSADDDTLNQKRIDYAEDFNSRYAGGGGGSGLSTNCLGNIGSVDTSNLVQLAIVSAWPNRQDSKTTCSAGLVGCGMSSARPEYIAAKAAAEASTSPDPIRDLFASCDRFVATMLRATGTDVKFPWGSTLDQGLHLNGDNGWQKISCQNRQPGDVLWRAGHIMLYVGVVDGKDSLASASIRDRTGAIGGVTCTGDQFKADGSAAQGYRKVR